MIISRTELILSDLIFLLSIIMFNVISEIVKNEIEGKRGSNCSIFISIDDISDRGDILSIDKGYKISFAS